MDKIFPPISLVWLMLGVLALSACSTPDNSEPPAELTEIEQPEPLFLLWSLDTGKGGVNSFYDMQPLLLDNKLYTIDIAGVINQVDVASGVSDWAYETGLASIAGLSAAEGSLVATSREGRLARFDLQGESLQPRWQIRIQSEIRSPAIIAGDQVLVRSGDGKLTALDFATGDTLWSVSRRVPALSLTGTSHPVVHEDLVISGFDNGKLVAFERANGSTVWETTIGTPSGRTEIERLVDLDGQFVLRDGVIYASTFQGNLAAVTANSGQVLWSRKFSSFKAIELDSEALYLTDDKSHVWAIDRRTGSAFWRQEALHARSLTAPRLVDNKLVVADLEGYVHILARDDGRILARAPTADFRYISQPLALNSTVFVLDYTGNLTALSQSR